MKQQNILKILVPVIGLLALSAAAAGLFVQGGEGTRTFTTLHGQTVELYGRGLYANDTVMTAGGFRGTDLVTIVFALPLLAVSFRAYLRGKIRGGLLLAGVLSYFLYNGISMSFAAAYNNLFLLYTALMSASLFAFVVIFSSIDADRLEKLVSDNMLRKRIAAYFFLAGFTVLALWGMEIVAALLSGEPPVLLGPYTTSVTHALDMGVIAPTAFLSGVLLIKRRANACRVGFPIIVLNILIGLCVISQTVMQTLVGVVFSTGQMVGIIGSWTLLAGLAIWSGVSMYRSIREPASR